MNTFILKSQGDIACTCMCCKKMIGKGEIKNNEESAFKEIKIIVTTHIEYKDHSKKVW